MKENNSSVDEGKHEDTLNQVAIDSNTDQSKASGAFSKALQAWIEIDLPSLQKELDEQALEIKEDQKSSLISRKSLASKTKDFKKLPDEEKLDQFKPLLKLYQNEIDSLTNKKKHVENHFFGVYRAIAEAPDPKPLLEGSLQSVIESSETEKLKQEVANLTDLLSKKADYDLLKERLLRNEQKSAELLSSKLKAKDDEYKALIDEKESNWAQKEKNYEENLKDAKNKIEELRTSKEVTELQLSSHNKQVGQSESHSSILSELEMVTRDAESAKKRVYELEKRNEKLRRELTVSQSDAERQNLKEEFKKKVFELEGENALLSASLEQYRSKIESLVKENNAKYDVYKREASQAQQEIKSLKEKVQKMSDYDDLKSEVQLLRQIEFGFDDEASDSHKPDSSNNKEIDSLLLNKNKALNKELSSLRSQHQEMVDKITLLEEGLTNLHTELLKAREVNARLEDDLSRVNESTASSKFNDNMSLVSGISKVTSHASKSGTLLAGNQGVGEDNSMLSIITKQRDRFRDRNVELEEELRKNTNHISTLRREIGNLKRDNEELYERTRYLASFKKNNDVQGGSLSNNVTNKRLQPVRNAIDLESNTYQENYESKLHPIEQFRIREQERINSKLSPIERLFISLTRAILATRGTRMLFATYCFCLHFMVMLMTIYVVNLNTKLIPEVGNKHSTGGITDDLAGSVAGARVVGGMT